MTAPPALPIDEVLASISASLAHAPNLVLKAPTGAGKTLRVAPALLAIAAVRGAVLLLEPRRVAARAAARRIALQRGATLGDEIGYHVRFDRKAGAATRVVAMTYGIFLRRLQDDPFLDGVGAVVFDEFHERSLDADLSLAMLRKTQRDVRADLRVVVMSATLDAGPVARFLGDAPAAETSGRSYPVEIRHRAIEDAHAASHANPYLAAVSPARSAAVASVEALLEETPGDVLVFLPGVGEIRRVHSALEPLASARAIDVVELYGDLPAEQQDAALRRGPRRKVVLATNVAESSVTIENVTGVVDSGLARVMRFDARVGIDRLVLGRISRASADQRTGRAGRTAPGVAIRLWSAHEDRALRPVEEPEIRRVDLSRAVLELRAWGEPDVKTFEWFESPDVAALAAGESLLGDLGALSGRGLSDVGRTLARLPLPPRSARLLVEGERLGVARRAALAAALLSERDPLRRDHAITSKPASAHESDVLERVMLVERFADSASQAPSAWPDLHLGATRSVLRVAADLARSLRVAGEPALRKTSRSRMRETARDESEEALLRALLAAYPDRVAARRLPGTARPDARASADARGVMVGGRGVRLAPDSVVATAELFLCISVDAGRRGERAEALVRQASAIERGWLPPESLRTVVETTFEEATGSVLAFARTYYRDLALEEKPATVTREAAGELLAEHASRAPERCLDLGEEDVRAWLARVRSLAGWMPELGLPRFEAESLGELARELAAGKRSFEEIRRAPLLDVLRASLTHDQRRALERHAPERITIPSGSAIRLDYEPGRAPVLAARIQEMFGIAETPRVAAGRIAVVLHLLAPNGRPAQVTEDLASFWKNTYGEVRKELRARYPKHAWPEDPLSAKAERRPGGKRR